MSRSVVGRILSSDLSEDEIDNAQLEGENNSSNELDDGIIYFGSNKIESSNRYVILV